MFSEAQNGGHQSQGMLVRNFVGDDRAIQVMDERFLFRKARKMYLPGSPQVSWVFPLVWLIN